MRAFLIVLAAVAGIVLVGVLAAAAIYLWALLEVTVFLLQVMGGPV